MRQQVRQEVRHVTLESLLIDIELLQQQLADEGEGRVLHDELPDTCTDQVQTVVFAGVEVQDDCFAIYDSEHRSGTDQKASLSTDVSSGATHALPRF